MFCVRGQHNTQTRGCDRQQILQRLALVLGKRVRWAGWGLIFRLCDWISSRWPSRLPEHSCSYVAFRKRNAVRMYAVRHKAVCTVPADVDIVNYAPWTSGISYLTDRNRRKAHQAVHGGSIWVIACNTDTRKRDREAFISRQCPCAIQNTEGLLGREKICRRPLSPFIHGCICGNIMTFKLKFFL